MRRGLVGVAASVMVAATVGLALTAHALPATSAETTIMRCADFTLDVHVKADGAVAEDYRNSPLSITEIPQVSRGGFGGLELSLGGCQVGHLVFEDRTAGLGGRHAEGGGDVMPAAPGFACLAGDAAEVFVELEA